MRNHPLLKHTPNLSDPDCDAPALFAAIPLSAVGALLLVAGTDLALSKGLLEARPACWPAIAIAAVGTGFLNPAVGLAVGCAVEAARAGATRIARRSAVRAVLKRVPQGKTLPCLTRS